MPFGHIPGTDTEYGLLCVDADAHERTDDPDGLMSQQLLARAAAGNVTNVFVFIHGWMGDIPAAMDQFERWIHAFDTSADRERAARLIPGFMPLYIGLHWPSLLRGDEEFGDASFAADDTSAEDERLASYLSSFGDTPAIRAALTTILAEADGGTGDLSAPAREAFVALDAELGLSGGPDADGLPFDPDDLAAAQDGVSFDESDPGLVMRMLRTLSYWSMKKRARRIGESVLHDFVRALQQQTQASRTGIHLMGHSFGCVVVSSILAGVGGRAPLPRPIDSVALVQGAVSLWAYAPVIPGVGEPGYYAQVLRGAAVAGPVITTRSEHDDAVNWPYWLASRVSGAYAFDADDYPRYGAVGRFGLQGLSREVVIDAVLADAQHPYRFQRGRVYNLDASTFICTKEGAAGAHNDIAGPEVAHAIWEAALASRDADLPAKTPADVKEAG